MLWYKVGFLRNTYSRVVLLSLATHTLRNAFVQSAAAAAA